MITSWALSTPASSNSQQPDTAFLLTIAMETSTGYLGKAFQYVAATELEKEGSEKFDKLF